MELSALWLSVQLGLLTVAVLLPLGIAAGRWLSMAQFRGKAMLEAAIALPLVLPPTVIGFYLLVSLGAASPVGQAWLALFGRPLVFTFEGLLIASIVVNVPFAIQPIQRAFEAIPDELREAAADCGASRWQTLRRIELPMAWHGIVTAMVLCFAHTLGEFGAVLMVGGSIPGETRTMAIAIYDRMQALDTEGAGALSLVLVAVSLATIAVTFAFTTHAGRRG
jgi:molybdate transport system permease protein